MRLLVAIVLMLASTVTLARTGNELVRVCKSDDPDFHSGLCMGYFEAIADTRSTYELLRKDDPSINDGNPMNQYCIPSTVTMGQAMAVFKKYAAENPENLHHPADWVISLAFIKAFPCREKGR